MICTCGSQSVGHPGHTFYCDFDKKFESGWEEFIRMSKEGWTGVYAYVTTNPWKLSSPLDYDKGVWLVLNPRDFKNNPKLALFSVTRIWVEKSVAWPDILDDADMYLGPAGVLRICEEID